MERKGFNLIDKFTIVSIALIGTFFSIHKISVLIRLNSLLNQVQEEELLKAITESQMNYLEIIPYLALAIGAIYLLFSANKTAWIITCIPLFIVTFYFSYQVLQIILSQDSRQETTPIVFLNIGFLITVNFILLLFCYSITSKRFKEKLKG